MRPNSKKAPKEARREKNTMLAVSHQHKSARGRADCNTRCATPVASLRKAWNRNTTGLFTWAILHPLNFLHLIVLFCPLLGQHFMFSHCPLSALKKISTSFLTEMVKKKSPPIKMILFSYLSSVCRQTESCPEKGIFFALHSVAFLRNASQNAFGDLCREVTHWMKNHWLPPSSLSGS